MIPFKKAGCLLLLFASLSLAAQTERPNVLFIAVDDLNNWVGFLDNHPGVKTPHMDQLAKQGMLFTNAYCSAPGCNASRSSLFTGLRPSSTGIYANGHDWRKMDITKDLETLPVTLQNGGYKTVRGGKLYHAHTLRESAYEGHLDPEPWDGYFPSRNLQLPPEVEPASWPVNTTKMFYQGRWDWAPLDIEDAEMGDAKVVSWAEGELSKTHDKPLFLGVGIYRPHWPWWTPQSYFDQHPLDEIEFLPEPEDDLDDLPAAGRKMVRSRWDDWILDKNLRSHAMQAYLASMTFADAMVGRLLRALENGPLADNTIIILWSDHGYHIGQKHHWEKFALWEQTTNVPLIIVDPRNEKAGTRISQPVSLLDLYPTIADLCGLEAPEHLEGTSLFPLLRNPEVETNRGVITTQGLKNHAVRSAHWRYIRYADGSEELYDHRNDPQEFTNLAGQSEFDFVKRYLGEMLPLRNVKPPARGAD
ncbi:sulfatase [Opitutia bacterium ISCC 51]|nr:sulfatase [Opitutae bacterium ISCC 51]QXD29964.1 sulfatase [Opitutae bacterium ISCC 52]